MKNKKDMIKWLNDLKSDIGQPQHSQLWHYAEILDVIAKYLESTEPKPVCEDTISRQAAIHDVSTMLWHMPNELHKNLNSFDFVKEIVTEALSETPVAPTTEQHHKEKEHDSKSICHTCATNNCPFQSGIYRNNCYFYTSANKVRR